MPRRDFRETLHLVGLIATLAVAVATAGAVVGRIRLVELVILFFSAFAAGAATVAWSRRRRARRAAEEHGGGTADSTTRPGR